MSNNDLHEKYFKAYKKPAMNDKIYHNEYVERLERAYLILKKTLKDVEIDLKKIKELLK